ncbi:uncharacterized protein B0I36DRAFT_349381 [Microdochium trichocladiopsis]|uniref:Uncharacterized protein n=1 Tax=Microdochium trichocladiopsis TaxID=1682393 RepID=A0A9P8Y7G6_9PEZI|nr:uncharacterized protein B0I36DRAFT_349381 [Microdochium trichocladiopsis]KAH7031288.1 hypothetical protein B0I36DRAFT_349381 [Microdochium trichocladiopsis]
MTAAWQWREAAGARTDPQFSFTLGVAFYEKFYCIRSQYYANSMPFNEKVGGFRAQLFVSLTHLNYAATWHTLLKRVKSWRKSAGEVGGSRTSHSLLDETMISAAWSLPNSYNATSAYSREAAMMSPPGSASGPASSSWRRRAREVNVIGSGERAECWRRPRSMHQDSSTRNWVAMVVSSGTGRWLDEISTFGNAVPNICGTSGCAFFRPSELTSE